MQKESLAVSAYKNIREAIIFGEFQPETKLNEVQIATSMNLSRSPLREALRQLASDGLVETCPYKGTVVAKISGTEIRDVFYPIRETIERYAMKCAATMLKDDDFAQLLKIVEKMTDSNAQQNITTMSELDLEFHRIIVKGTTSPGLYNTWRSVSSRILMVLIATGEKLPSMDLIVQDHKEIYDMLKEGNMEKIAQCMDRHLKVDDGIFSFDI